jgi:histidine triad (HIT) family protein
MSCLFCKIVEGSIPSKAVYRDEHCYAFADISPQAPVHVVIVPLRHLDSLAAATASDTALLGHLQWAAAQIARQLKLDNGYRVVVNTGADGGQSVEHLHLHLLGGRALAWPPG